MNATPAANLVVHARVRCVLDVRLSQPWDGKETCEVIINRARIEAEEQVRTALGNTATHVIPPVVYMAIANREEATP